MAVLEYQGAAAASAVIMSHVMRSKKIVFVESASDGRVLNSLLDDGVTPISARGVEGVLEALNLISQHKSDGGVSVDAVGFVDRDYIDLNDINSILGRNDIVTTCHRDIEIDLFHTKCTRRVLEEKGSAGKWDNENSIVDGILISLSRLSMLRAYNAVSEKSWDFKCIDLSKYVDTSGNIDESRLFSNFRQKNGVCNNEWGEFEAWESGVELCPKSITRGHDVACVFGQMLRKALGNRKKDEATIDVVEENLRLAIERKFVEVFDWFKRLFDWAYNNCVESDTPPQRHLHATKA
jgi:hypothetical protein